MSGFGDRRSTIELRFYMERIRRFELPHSAWKANMLPITSYPQIARLSGLSGVVKTTHPPPILFIDVDSVHLFVGKVGFEPTSKVFRHIYPFKVKSSNH